MENEEEEPQPPFRWNWQAMVMLAVTGLALAIPLAGVAMFAQGYFSQRMEVKTPPAPQLHLDPLRASLEQAAAASLGGPARLSEEGDWEIAVPAAEIEKRIRSVAQLARALGGSAVETASTANAARRLLVQAPEGSESVLRQVARGEKADRYATRSDAAMKVVAINFVTP